MMCERCSQTDGGPQGPYGPQKTCGGEKSLNMTLSSCTLLVVHIAVGICTSASNMNSILTLRRLEVGSISHCAGRNVGWEFCSSKLMMEKILQLGFFPAGQDEFSPRINAQAEPRQPLTAAHLGTRTVGRHAFNCSGTKESWESSS